MFNVIDFFCGCGGTSAGLRSAGMNIIAGIDYDEKAIKTYQKNFPEAVSIQKDIKRISEDEIAEIISSHRISGPLVFQHVPHVSLFRIKIDLKKYRTRASVY